MSATATPFLTLSADDRRDAYGIAAEQLGRNELALEKDVWVVWTLDVLFGCPGLPAMAFKGGTSLSKVYEAITRFSEYVDVTMDCRELAPQMKPFDSKSRKQRDRDDETLKALVRDHSTTRFVPHLNARIAELGVPDVRVETEMGGEVVWVRYPTAYPNDARYLSEGVKIEFGGRNMTEPNDRVTVQTYLADAIPGGDVFFPTAQVNVLAAERTFWEKFTLAHAESNRHEFRKSSERLSRHWSDLAVLSAHPIAASALNNRSLLEDVVQVKTRFFNNATAQYGQCLNGEANLIPGEEGLARLRADYEQMVTSGMLDNATPFHDMIEKVRALQDTVNHRSRT